MAEPKALVLIGAGGHAKVVADTFRAHAPGFQIIGATDADPRPRSVAGLQVLGTDEELERLRREGVDYAFAALGDNAARARVAKRLLDLGFQAPNAIHGRAAISPEARLGRGLAVMAGAVINVEAEIGDFAIINSGAVVEHDCRIAAFAHLGPNSTVAGGVSVGARSLIGAGATVIPGVTIGDDVIVGAGACVLYDLPDGVLAIGTPARPVRLAGRRHD